MNMKKAFLCATIYTCMLGVLYFIFSKFVDEIDSVVVVAALVAAFVAYIGGWKSAKEDK